MPQDPNQRDRIIRVLVADNSPFHTELLASTLARDPDFEVVSSPLTTVGVAAASRLQLTDVFVLSSFTEGDAQLGLKTLRELRETNPSARAVMLLNSSTSDSILEAFRAGARGVFHIQEDSDVLRRCIHRVHEGQAWVSRDQMTLLLEALVSTPKIKAVDRKGLSLLTKREAEVVACLAEGMTNREIAERIGLSQHTIKNYLFRIFDKLGVSNRIELLFMTLSPGAAPPPLPRENLDSEDAYDEATLGSCQKAAENGVIAAQLALARIFSMGPNGDRDLVEAYAWFSIAADQITRTKNALKQDMTPSQIAAAERQVREWLDKTLPSERSSPPARPMNHDSPRPAAHSSVAREENEKEIQTPFRASSGGA